MINIQFPIRDFKLGIRNSSKGFTLIEAVVSTAVFSMVIVSVLGVYASVLKLDRRTRTERAVQQNARFILEYFSKDIRNGTIDYSKYPGANANNSSTSLWVINQANENESFFLSGTDLKLQKNVGGTDVTTNLNSSDVKVTRASFLLSPPQDPLTVAKTYNQQPSVTIILELTSSSFSPGEGSKINLQTTLTSRAYPSREPPT
jgi:Tfp pilus assembly protein PilE